MESNVHEENLQWFKEQYQEWTDSFEGIIDEDWEVLKYLWGFKKAYTKFSGYMSQIYPSDVKKLAIIALKDLHVYYTALENLDGTSKKVFNLLEDFKEFVFIAFDRFIELLADFAGFDDETLEEVYNYIWENSLEDFSLFLEDLDYDKH